MIDVYVKELEEDEGHLLGSFQPHQLRDLPDLFKIFSVLDPLARDCILVETRFVLEGGCYFEILVAVKDDE